MRHEHKSIIMKPSDFPPSLAWTTVFVPALCYVLATRMTGFRYGRIGDPVEFTLFPGTDPSYDIHKQFGSLFRVENGGNDIVSSVWKHDSELGRGYLLYSEASGQGRVWRWEVGGGPIAIGRTLQLDGAGCRSSKAKCCEGCREGGAGLAVDFKGHDHASEGKLIVAEIGEERVVRLEENGARTPLVLNTPSLCRENAMSRLGQVHNLLMSPSGDLIFSEYQSDCKRTGIWTIRGAIHVPALSSLQESREAHEWSSLPSNASLQLLMETELVAGLSVSPLFDSLAVSCQENGTSLIRQVFMEKNEDYDEEDEDLRPAFSKWSLFNVTRATGSKATAYPSVVTESGLVVAGTSEGLAVIDPVKNLVVGRASIGFPPTSFTLGHDGYFYMTSKSSVYRASTKEKPISFPTNKIRSARQSS